MKTIERFEKFFEDEGVPTERWKPTLSSLFSASPDEILTVSQAHFLFRNGEYLGVQSDDMGDFEKKI
jgi:hypothetical protein